MPDSAVFNRQILPGLRPLPVSELAAATGLVGAWDRALIGT